MKQKTNRWLSMLLAFIMLLTLVPAMNVFAGYEDGEDCWHCGHYHWDGYLCGCGACSTSCTNADCWLETHCNNCGMCLMEDGGFCSECNYCTECMAESGWHCSECKQCFLGDEDGNLCGNCGRCASCVAICQDCGFCQECFEEEDDEMHCPLCGSCYEVNEPCEFVENNHCKECCYPCDQCGKCTYNEDVLATCPDCGLCVECCEENSKEAGCDDGSVCVESGDWLDGLCTECGIFFNDSSDMCDLCVDSAMARCKDCCAASSQCSEGMCENDNDYDEHFCIDCGQCFHDSEQCNTCAEPRCKECCEDLTATNYGCSHGICADSGDLEEHLDECEDLNDGEYTDDHDATPSIRWSYDKKVHYHECRFCESEEHYTSKAAHTFDKNGVCTVCGSHAGSEPYIYRQPKNFRCKVSVYDAFDEYPEEGLLWKKNNFATFTVVAKGGQGKLSYQWYGYYRGNRDYKLPGATSPTLKIEISTKGCMIADYDYYCVITDEAGKSVKTNIASIRADHAYGSKFAESTELEKGESIENADYKGGTFYYLNASGKKESVTVRPSKGHRYPCMSEVDDDEHIHYKNSTPVHHTFGVPKVEGRSARSGAASTDKLYRIICTACGYTTFRESHKHNFTFTSFGNVWPNVDMEKTSALTKEKLLTGHVVACSVEGCETTRMEMHDWQWKYTGGDCDFPSETKNGYYTRKCKVCEYEPNDFNAKDKDGNIISWTKDNILIIAENATASKILANDGDKLTLRLMRNADTIGKRCTGWTVEYQIPEDDAVQVAYLTDRHTFVNNGDDSYTCTVSVGIFGTGGVLIFKPNFADCTEHNYQTVGYKDAVCMKDGYMGDRVCQNCGQNDPNDLPAEEKVIPATKTEHEGVLLPLFYDKNDKTPTTDRSSGKRYHFKAGSCTVKGYEGDFRCSKCESTVLGKWEYQHNEEDDQRNWSYPSCFKAGYTGDFYCRDCGKISRRGEKIPAIGKHTEDEGYVDLALSTCTATGLKKYKCYVCNIVIREEIQPALGHDWVKDEANSTATIAAYKCDREDCVATKLENIAPEKFDIIITNGTATKAGSAISKAASGTVVTITADPAETGKQFDKWEVVYGGVTVADVNSATTTFTMGGEAVKIKATYKDADPEHTHTYGEWVSDETNHWKVCACSHIAELAAHTESDWIIVTPATATKNGIKRKECTVCRRVLESDTIPALGYTITFELNYSSGTATTAQTNKEGKLTALPTPSRSGYTFNGWYTEATSGTKITESYTFTADTTVYAHWTKKSTGGGGGGGTTRYTVSFETNGGNKVANQSVTRNSVMKEPAAPTKEGFDFAGWYTDKELKTKYDFSAKVTKSLTLYAAWTEKDNSVNQIILTIGEKSAQVFGKAQSNDVAPKIVNNRTMLPARFVAENLGANVEWDGDKELVTITGKNLKTGEDVTILITIGAENAVVNGKAVKLDSPAFIENNRTYTPIRFISEELGASVEWLEKEQKVVITKVQTEEK